MYMNIKYSFIPIMLLLVSFGSCNLTSGSFPFAEIYSVNSEELELIKAIEKFKTENPKYSVPDKFTIYDGRRDNADYWYHVYFFYDYKETIVKCWVRPSGRGKTSFAFVGLNEGLKSGNWKFVNRDFNDEENEEQKRKFEKFILNEILENL